MGSLRTNVRWNDDTGGWELRCEDCARRGQDSAFWPLTMEYWRPAHGMTRCRACWGTVRRQRYDRITKEQRQRKNAAQRQRRYRAKLRAWKQIVDGVAA